ncbi:hypothetical protein [Nucisporomicrobium flavum]|uniref:hypothetical protein n=1 Tax=Nucisporomicrobium flavum TaxID=2785915 RepID=UPI0018F3F67E|nr:hypothetical protein [Nucisporomicrobium flavum]
MAVDGSLGILRQHIFGERFPLEQPPAAEGAFDRTDLTEDGPPLVAATYRLASDIMQTSDTGRRRSK